jgi:hypothetical protein
MASTTNAAPNFLNSSGRALTQAGFLEHIMQTWQNTDKTKWADGPWKNEPDKAQWIGEAGLDCLIVRGPSGALCGYVGVPPEHPLYEKCYQDIKAANGDYFDVHGGLTFADACQPTEDPSKNICHLEETAANKKVWWFGFDCAHSGDTCPGYPSLFPGGYQTYKSIRYVQQQCESLARQLAAVH